MSCIGTAGHIDHGESALVEALTGIDPGYHRRRQEAVLRELETLERGAPEELILAVLTQQQDSSLQKKAAATSISLMGKSATAVRNRYKRSGYELTEIAKQSNLPQDVTLTILETLLKERRVRNVEGWWFAQSLWDALRSETFYLVSEQHRQYPLWGGLSKEEWRTRLGLSPRMATGVFLALKQKGVVTEAAPGARISGATGGLIRLPDFVPTLTFEQQRQVEQLLQKFHATPYTPPGRAEVEAEVGPEVLGFLLEQGIIVRLGGATDPVLFLRETYDEAVARLIAYLREHKTVTAAEARDILGNNA